jgi:hypothetical protein
MFKPAFTRVTPSWVSRKLFSKVNPFAREGEVEHELESPSGFYPSLATLMSCTNDPLGPNEQVLSLHSRSVDEAPNVVAGNGSI